MFFSFLLYFLYLPSVSYFCLSFLVLLFLFLFSFFSSSLLPDLPSLSFVFHSLHQMQVHSLFHLFLTNTSVEWESERKRKESNKMEWDKDASEPEGTTKAKSKRSNVIPIPQDEAHLRSHHKKCLLAEESMTQEC